ncbi:TPA: hypothetical protein TZW69_000748 [Streptococcus suis]|uniref:hypothetical protein n=1 Tax=Streptococcus suis TaxID=1307 RepID=UPI000CF550FD|nr:hypothetical protein [Streptococcus suis]MCQ8272252.1 hypothetical protein [Streptococcus suis]MDY7601094.1 hypothetical protein [Streptococcus suis]UUM49467.1 hypothetical protein NQZ97_00325 [Streptococcus suis]WNF69485.1 hypothetical protein RJW57_00300 [Streptococcus suis]HEL1642311.1 hypothetical protein [Streptococcus suis]
MEIDFFNTNNNTLKTDSLEINNNILAMRNNTIQINNISMMSNSELKFQVTIREIVAILFFFSLLFIDFIPKIIPMIVLAVLGYNIYQRYQKHLKDKYFIEFNLGSSKNYYLFFEDKNFRDEVSDVIKKSFNLKGQTTYIDIKNQNINSGSGTQEVIEDKTVHETNIAGNDNIVGTNFGQGNTISIKGDAVSNSNITENAKISNSNLETNKSLPWEAVTADLNRLINEKAFSDELRNVFSELLDASKEKNFDNFNSVVKENEKWFDNSFVKDVMSSTLSNIISGILLM